MRKMLLMVAALIGIGALPAAAGPITILNETGIGATTCNTSTGCTYALSFTPTDGQLLLFDPSVGLVLDYITFDSATKTATFASDPLDGFDDPADVNAPPPLQANTIILAEPFPVETLFYTPKLGQPGFSTDPLFFGYSVTSDTVPNDSVPEPSSILLLGAGLLGIVGVMRRKLLR